MIWVNAKCHWNRISSLFAHFPTQGSYLGDQFQFTVTALFLRDHVSKKYSLRGDSHCGSKSALSSRSNWQQISPRILRALHSEEVCAVFGFTLSLGNQSALEKSGAVKEVLPPRPVAVLECNVQIPLPFFPGIPSPGRTMRVLCSGQPGVPGPWKGRGSGSQTYSVCFIPQPPTKSHSTPRLPGQKKKVKTHRLLWPTYGMELLKLKAYIGVLRVNSINAEA